MTDRRLEIPGTLPGAIAPSKPGLSKQRLRLRLYIELLILDCLALFAAFTVAGAIRGSDWLAPNGISLTWLVIPVYVLMALKGDVYSIEVLRNRGESMRRALMALVSTVLVLLMIGFFLGAGYLVSRLAFGSAVVVSVLFVLIARYIFHAYAVSQYRGALVDELLIVDGVSMSAEGARNVLNAQAAGIRADLQDPYMLARVSAILQGFDRVVIACPAENQHNWSVLLKGSELTGEIVVPDGATMGAIGVGKFANRETVVVSRASLSLVNRAKKRAFDLALTVPALVLLSGLFLVVACAIWIEDRGPIFFRQQRIGRGNRIFHVLKFRSMRVQACDSNGSTSTQHNDKRVTRVGRFIRKTSIDELPQLLNVLRGDMSIVGPRPHALGSLAGDKLFWEVNETYWMRHALKPGITGLAQIRGYRGATHQQEDLEKRLQSDLEYVNGWRAWRDVTILFSTLGVLVHPNAY